MSLRDRLAATRPPVPVVLADDEPLVHQMVGSVLAGRNLALHQAANGVDALELVRRERPHLIIHDVDLPELDGVEVCAAIRADPALAGTKVLILTAGDDLAAIFRGKPGRTGTSPNRLAQRACWKWWSCCSCAERSLAGPRHAPCKESPIFVERSQGAAMYIETDTVYTDNAASRPVRGRWLLDPQGRQVFRAPSLISQARRRRRHCVVATLGDCSNAMPRLVLPPMGKLLSLGAGI
jgi:CheY-like chemotaxis protein